MIMLRNLTSPLPTPKTTGNLLDPPSQHRGGMNAGTFSREALVSRSGRR
jgi:hypothetical protein